MKKLSLTALIIIIIDRIIKILVDIKLNYLVKYKLIGNFLYLLNCHNEGAAFSILNGNIFFLIIITIIVLYFFFNYLRKKDNITKKESLYYGLLLGGIIGNLIDRIVFGYVIDYIGINIFNYNFPIFNLADVSIVIGAFILIINEFGGDKNESNSNSK